MEICLIFYSYYIVRTEYIYIHHVGYVCSVSISIVFLGYITNLLTLKLNGFHRESIRRPCAPQPDALPLHQATRYSQSDIFGYVLPFSLISTLN